MMTHNPTLGAKTAGPSFSEAQLAALDRLMESFIPASADGRMPSAKSLSLYADIRALPPKDRERIESGLAELDTRSIGQHGLPFTQLASVDAQALVAQMRSERSPFIQVFVMQTAGRYLAHPRVIPLLGLEARPLWPKGNVVKEGDWSLIDVVRKRPKIYREV